MASNHSVLHSVIKFVLIMLFLTRMFVESVILVVRYTFNLHVLHCSWILCHRAIIECTVVTVLAE
jgi:hypothetical protein